MHFHHLHFYVQDAAFWSDWFIHKLAFQACDTSERNDDSKQDYDKQNDGKQDYGKQDADSTYKTLKQGEIEIRLSDPHSSFDADSYLQHHPAGVVDVALATDAFDAVLEQAIAQGATLLQPVSGPHGQRQCQLQGWADLRHTLIEEAATKAPSTSCQVDNMLRTASTTASSRLCAIDHVVLNVAKGKMAAASAWYKRIFGLIQGQRFEITTAHSGLCSQVLVHPSGSLQLPINEPSSANSQVQEFLDHNRGAGIQHVALRSLDAIAAIAYFRQQGLDLIRIPTTYYEDLRHRPHCPLPDTTAASAQKLLLDWASDGKQGVLLQTFTKPIFPEPTFFFEIIERGTYAENGQIKNAQGFGEGNFQALFEAIERDQIERGSLE
ncbi:MAG: 4-hydroxyphenylpyruvate dioxygenase [Phormidesmis sp.]